MSFSQRSTKLIGYVLIIAMAMLSLPYRQVSAAMANTESVIEATTAAAEGSAQAARKASTPKTTTAKPRW